MMLYYQTPFIHTDPAAVWGWFSDTYRDMKTVCALLTDDMKGHAEGGHLGNLCKAFGQEILDIAYYPLDTSDFSAYATKIKMIQPIKRL